MSVLALDWNATRVRAVLGDDNDAEPMALDPPSVELPLALALGAKPEVGGAALRRSRVDGHLVCQSFLPYLNEKPGQGPFWQAGRYRLDAFAACEHFWQRLQKLAVDAKSIVLTVPDYLRPGQAMALCKIGEKLRLPIVGSVPGSLSAGLAGISERSWHSSLVVVDVDEHALTLCWLKTLADNMHVVESRSLPHLGLRVWRERLIDMLSDLFVLEHRRDPRDAPQAEQSLFDQLDILTDAAHENRALQIAVQGQSWFKHLLVHPEQTEQFCRQLVNATIGEAEQLLFAMPHAEWPPVMLMTRAAGRLPGLVTAMQSVALVHPSAETKLPQIKATAFDGADFGERLLIHDDGPSLDVHVLRAEAPARAAHRLAESFRTGALLRGHLDLVAPLPFEGRKSLAV
jgi:hypothetical protein